MTLTEIAREARPRQSRALIGHGPVRLRIKPSGGAPASDGPEVQSGLIAVASLLVGAAGEPNSSDGRLSFNQKLKAAS